MGCLCKTIEYCKYNPFKNEGKNEILENPNFRNVFIWLLFLIIYF